MEKPRYAIITGATSGIGREFAVQLASRGHDLVIGGKRAELLEELATSIRETHRVKVRTIVGDLCRHEVEAAFADAIRTAAPQRSVSYLVNSAGAGFSTTFAGATPETIDRAFALLAGVPSRLANAALPGMVKAGAGTIINVGSLAGRLPVPGSSLYVATKVFLERLTETIALEVVGSGVVVQALLPGFVKTDFHRDIPDIREKQRGRGLVRWAEPGMVVGTSLARADRARRHAKHSPGAVPRVRDIVVVPGFLNRVLVVLSGILPRRLLYLATLRRFENT